jgi:hypothetical protein
MFSHLSETPRTKDLRITLPQSFWFKEQGKINVDFIGSLENITEDMNYVLNKININIQFENRVENKSIYKLNFDNAYNQELIDLVAEKEAGVIELKGYDYIA